MRRTAIVTGGRRGIGLAISRQLAQDGYNIVTADRRSADEQPELKEYFTSVGAEHLHVQADIGTSEDRARIVREAVERFGAIHVLVNNAGVAPSVRNDLLEMTEESFDRVIGINTKGTMFLTQLVAKQMLTQEVMGRKRGVIVNVSSCSAEVASIGRGEYCVSKAGVSMLTSLFATRLAPEGILVNEVRPGVISTDMTSGVAAKYDAMFESGVFPIARWGLPEDIAGAVSALVSDKFLYTTGSYIDVDGGFHIKRL